MKHEVLDIKGKKPELVHAVVTWQRGKRRAGSHSTLNRARMEGGGRKPYRQKGTGNARAGTNISPVWVGGAVAHGPTPRSYKTRVTKRTRRQALNAVLADKVKSGTFIVLESLVVPDGKTKSMVSILNSVGVKEVGKEGGATLLLSKEEHGDAKNGAVRASRNIPGITTLSVDGANVYDLVNRKNLICTKSAIEALQERILQANSKDEVVKEEPVKEKAVKEKAVKE